MGIAFSFTVDDGSVRAGMVVINANVKNLIPFWEGVFAPAYFAQVQDLFALEGQSRGSGGQFGPGSWAPLSPAYAAWKKRHFPGKLILERTGKMRESLNWQGASLGAGGVFVPRRDAVTVGTSVAYGKYHQHGTPKMPRREFLPTPDARHYARMLSAWILGREVDT